MITAYVHEGGRLVRHEGLTKPDVTAVWIDLLSPVGDEEAQIESLLGIDVPTKEEMEEIEVSSRLYTEGGASFMTAILPANADGDDVDMQPVTFVLTPTHLITVRYHEPQAFRTFRPSSSRSAARET